MLPIRQQHFNALRTECIEKALHGLFTLFYI